MAPDTFYEYKKDETVKQVEIDGEIVETSFNEILTHVRMVINDRVITGGLLNEYSPQLSARYTGYAENKKEEVKEEAVEFSIEIVKPKK